MGNEEEEDQDEGSDEDGKRVKWVFGGSSLLPSVWFGEEG